MKESLLTLNEVAVILKVTYRTVLKYMKTGKLRARRVGGCWRVLRADLDDFLEEDPETVKVASKGQTIIMEVEEEE